MNLFEPDIFSNSKPIWIGVGQEFSSELIEKLRESSIPISLDEIDKVYYCGGNEINSKNYLLSSKNRSYVIKNWGEKSEDNVNRIIKIQQWLKNYGLPVESALRNYTNSPIRINNSCWDIFPFIDGDYFSGTQAEYHQTLESIKNLHTALKLLPVELCSGEKIIYFTDDDIETFNDINKRIKIIDEYLPVDIFPILKENWTYLNKIWSIIKEKSTLFAKAIVFQRAVAWRQVMSL